MSNKEKNIKLHLKNIKTVKMNSLHKILLLLICFMSGIGLVKAQEIQGEEKNAVHVISRPLKDSIILRWAPSDFITWQYGNQYGYMIERYTLMRNEVLLVNPERNFINSEAFKPLDLYDWEPLVKANKLAAITAQAIYGESFDVDAGEGFSLQQASKMAQEQQMRFAFALHAADKSPEVARASGLWYTDKEAKENEKYLYRVYINLPDTLHTKIDTGFVFTGISDYTPLPKPVEFNGEFSDKMCLLSWNILAHDKIYLAWELERSANKGRSYQAVSKEPLVPFKPQKAGEPMEYSFKLDSLPQNGKEYRYRLRGITPFGEKGAWSEVITGKGIEAIKASPHIVSHEAEEGRVQLTWDFEKEEEGSITGFKIIRSDNHKTGYEELATNLKPGTRTFVDRSPISIAYYKVVAYRDSEAEKASFPHVVQVVDETPPVKPQGLTGVADTNGLITLSWNPNPDKDILGYRVFRSASNNDEFSMMTYEVVTDTIYVDTVSKKDLNEAVFYKIVAFDQVYNQGEFSEVCEVVKPDITPPSLPVITDTRASETGIFVEWVNSTSLDVEQHVLYRKANDSAWKEIKTIPYSSQKSKSSFEDTGCETGIKYQYMVTARDEAMNESEPSYSIVLKALPTTKGDGLQKIQQRVDYEKGKVWLSWQLPEEQIEYIKIYRKTTTQPYRVFETLEGTATMFNDYGLKIGETYFYRVKLYYTNGKVSGFSDEIAVKF